MSQTQPTPAMNIGLDTDQLINTYPAYLRKRFGGRVQKITVDAGFSCPNRDGRKGTGGCIYCNNAVFSPAYRSTISKQSVREQLDTMIPKYKSRYKTSRFIAYFQPFTNTDAPIDKLENLYREALGHPDVIGISIGTRPDCVDDGILKLLNDLSSAGNVSVEYGCESVYDKSLQWINRGHSYQDLVDAVNTTSEYDIEICLHVILGFPTETRDETIAMARILSDLPIQRIKIHHLHVVKETKLEKMYSEHPFRIFSLPDYINLVSDFLECLSPRIIVERLSGESPADMTITPEWHIRNYDMFNLVRSELKNRGTYQGYKIRVID